MTECSTREAQDSPKKAYTAPTLVSLETIAALNLLRNASANGNEEAKSFLAKVEATFSAADRSGPSDVK